MKPEDLVRQMVENCSRASAEQDAQLVDQSQDMVDHIRAPWLAVYRTVREAVQEMQEGRTDD